MAGWRHERNDSVHRVEITPSNDRNEYHSLNTESTHARRTGVARCSASGRPEKQCRKTHSSIPIRSAAAASNKAQSTA